MVDTPLLDKYLGGKDDRANAVVNTPLLDHYLGSSADTLIPPPTNPNAPFAKSLGAGGKQGVLDVSDSLDPALQPTVGRLLNLPPTNEMRTNRRQQYEKEYGDDTVASVGRLGGQVLATAPMTPVGAISRSLGALPTITATGQKIAAPMLNRFGATMATGAAGGTVYGAGTNAVNEDGLASNIVSNAAAGAVGAPFIAGAGKLGTMIVPAMRSLKANVQVLNAARDAGLPASAIKNVVQRLDDAGLSPQNAITELNRLGSKATIADLDPSLTAEASGLAALGGKPTSILKNRFDTRAGEANNSARDLINSRLGPKPDLEVEKQAIVDRAQILTSPDYKAAKASGTKLDVSNISAHIDSELEKAVGTEASQLEKAKSYLYNSKGELKDDIASLHKVRQALDDTLSRLPKEGTSQGTATYRAVSIVRDLIDSKLKSIPEMAAADAKFSEHMKVKEGLQIGYDALTKKTNKDEFIKIYNAAAPGMQDTIRKGLRSAISDVMDASGQGEASGMARLLNKKEVNREILRTAFGAKGENVINAIHDEVAQRGTERAITQGSQTAERQAVRQRYQSEAGPNLGDFGLGGALDAYGAGGAATTAMLIKRGITNRLISMSENKLGRLTEGTADLLSRQGAERNIGMQVIDQVNKIQNRLSRPSKIEQLPLPKIPTLAAPFGGEAYAKIKEKVQ